MPSISQYEVEALLEEYRRLSKIFTTAMKGMKFPKNMKGDIPMNPRNMQQHINQMSKVLPPQLLQQMGGTSALQNLMKAMEGKK